MKNANNYLSSILIMLLFGNISRNISLFILCCIFLVNISCTQPEQQESNITLTDLMWSCLNLDYDSVARNIDIKIINRQNEYGNTALMYAVGVNSIDHGHKNNAIRNKIINLLVDSKADIDITNSDGVTSLIISVFHGDYDIASILVAHNANADIRDKHGFTALMYSAYHCNHKLAKLLIGISDKDIINNLGKTAKDIALDEECYSVASLL